MRAWLVIACLLLASLVHAQQPAVSSTSAAPAAASPLIVVRVRQDPPGPLVQGGTARIKVDLLTSNFFTDAPVLPALHVDGAYLSLSDETPGHLVEPMDGATWTGVSRTYLVTPLVSGSLEIPAFQVTAHIGAQRTPVAVQTTPLTLQVQPLVLPEGVTEALIASSLTLSQSISPEDTGLHVGDSLTRRIEITADGAPAMMLPPIEFKPVSGLRLYASPAATRDVIGNQGGFVGGSRVESVSYVIQRRGSYVLPPVTVRWMDSRTHAWRASSVPAVHFHAWWGAPARPRFALPQQGTMPRLIEWFSSDLGISTLLLVVLAWATWWYRDRLALARAQWKAWRYRRQHSESVAFAAVRKQRHASSAVVVAATVDAWVRRAAEDGGPVTVDAWCAAYGDAALRQQWSALQDTLFGEVSAAWSASAIVHGLASARQRWRQDQRRRRQAPALPPLNPA